MNREGNIAYISVLSGAVPFGGQPTGGDIMKCTLNPNGSFEQCTAQDVSNKGASAVIPVGMALTSSGNRLYISSEYNDENVFVCELDVSGDITSCADAGVGIGAIFNNPAGLALNASGERIYITNTNQETPNVPSVIVCPIDTATGLFTACLDANAPVTTVSSSAIALNTQNGLAYFTDLGTGGLFMCSIDTDTGLFTSCDSATGDGVFNFPIRVVFNASGAVGYVVQLNIPSGFPITANFAGKCDVDLVESGSLTCVDAEPADATYDYTTSTGIALRFVR